MVIYIAVLKECCYISLHLSYVGYTLPLFKPTHWAISNGHKLSFSQMQTEIYNLFQKSVTRMSHKFWFCSKPICCQTRRGCSANPVAEAIWFMIRSLRQGRNEAEWYSALLCCDALLKSRGWSHRHRSPSRHHPATQHHTPEDLNVRYTAEKTSPVTHSNQWPVSRHIMSPAAHCSRGGAS